MSKTLRILTACAVALVIGSSAHNARAQDKTVVVEAIGSNPPHFNRLLSTDIATMLVGAKVYETLVRIDSNYKILPSLATAWEANKDATEYRLTLREGVKWHDGKPFTSADVKFTFDTYIPLSPAASAFARFVQEVSAPDDKTVVVKFNAPYAPFLEALAGMWMLPKHVFGDGQNVATHPANARPVGTGPFKFDSFRSGDRVMLSRNDDYYGAKTDVQRMVFPILPDANSRKLALESGAIQYVYGSYIDKSAWQQIEKSPRFAAMRERGHVLTVTAHLNTTKGPLSNYDVRKAIFQALNRKAIGERAYYGYGTAARGPVPAEMSWAVSSDVDFNRDLPFDPAAAKALLDKAGFPIGSDGTRFTISLAHQADFSSLGLAGGLMQSNLADVGIKLNLIAEDGQIWRDRVYKNGNYDIGMVFYTTFEDPSLGVTRAYICNPAKIVYRNPTGLCDPALDADLAAAGATTDRAARQAAFTRAEKRIEGLLHTYPLVVEKQFYFGRTDLWDMDKAHETHPIDWSLVKARK